MSPGWRISPALLGAILAAALSFGVCFAVVADATRTVSPDRTAARPAPQAVNASLSLRPAAKLRVPSSVLPPPAPPPRRVVRAASKPPPATDEPPPEETQAPQTTTTTPAAPTPKPTPKPKPKPKPKPQPSGPDFDDSGPQGPPSGG